MQELADAERSPLLYLSQVDAQLTPYLSRKRSFISDLATRLLLESGVVITDVYFFNSPEVVNDLRRSDQSWVRHGLRRGKIVPAFREENAHSFTENGDRSGLWNNMGVLKDSRDIAITLDAVLRDPKAVRITWPERMGASYGKLLNLQFGRDLNDSDLWGARETRLWRQTRDLRNKYLELGWQRVRDPEVHGLRRADIYTVMAQDVGYTGDPANTSKIVDCADTKMRQALRATLLWVDELYHYNQATRLRVKSSFPVGRGPGALMMPELLSPGSGGTSDPSETWTYSHVIRWPSSEALRHMPPDRLLGLRSDTAGETYVSNLQAFRDGPSDITWEAFKESADAYAREVCDTVGPQVNTALEIKHMTATQKIALGTIFAGLAGSAATHESKTVAAYVVSQVTTAVGALYIPMNEYIRTRKASRQVQLLVEGGVMENRMGNVRIDLPARH
jgi:hypothetical protein